MFEYLGTILVDVDPGFDVLRYLTVRTIAGTVTALLLSILLGPMMIKMLERFQLRQFGVERGPDSHQQKSGTPTMGGLLIVSSLLLSILLWGDLSNRYLWVCLFVTVGFTVIGFLDDFLKIRYQDSKGLSGKLKLLAQTLVAASAVTFLYLTAENKAEISLILLFNKDWIFEMSMAAFIVFGTFVIVGSSNAVNLTDGLDGLAILPTVLIGGGLGLIAYAMGNQLIADYLFIPHLPIAGELIVFCGALIGSGIGFLWYNTYPAQVFMGDVGSLTLGAILGVLAVVLRHEIVYAIMAGVFIVETLSVMIQVTSYRLFKKRVFLMAPIHLSLIHI